MIIIDNLLKKKQEEGNPFKVAMIGAGFIGRGVAYQIMKNVPGMDLVAISNRSIQGAIDAYSGAGVESVVTVNSANELDDSISNGKFAVTDDAMVILESEKIDAILEVTGAVEFGAQIITKAFDHGKHVITMNAELDATVGSILKVKADKAGVVYTISDGDQPGVTMNLYRFVTGMGIRPILCGNIKGLQDRYRNPTTQESFAKQWGQTPSMVTSFADGTKISFEQAITANAIGMEVGVTGMYGPTVEPGTLIKNTVDLYPLDKHKDGPGIVDYIVGAEPGPGVYIFGVEENPLQQYYLKYYKLGNGPYYCFYTPYHLCHLEIANTTARALLFNDVTLASKGKPSVEVVATAKIDLSSGNTLDGIGHYMTYGLCENADVVQAKKQLPMGLAEGCKLKNDIKQDQIITLDDVEIPNDTLLYKLWQEQLDYFY